MGIILVIGCFILGAMGAWLIALYAARLGLIDLPNERSSHSSPTPRSGGLGILAAFLYASLILEIPYGFWLPASLLAAVSFFDDRLDLSPQVRLLFQFIAAIVVIYSIGLRIANPFVMFPLTLFFAIYIVGTANFYNFMDGINGIAGVTGIVAFVLISFFAAMSGAENSVVILSACVAASCLGFLPFNMPKARVFMGDVGSVLLGFVFASMVVWLTSDIASFICLIFFLAPFYIDSLTTILIRWRGGEKLFQAHRKHLYQILANELEYQHWIVSFVYGALQMFVGLLMIWAWTKGLSFQLILIVLFALIFIIISFRIRAASYEIVD